MSAQELLFKAYRAGVTIRANNGNMRLTPARLLAPARIRAVKACKPQLLALVTGLEQYGAQDDPLILAALALFNATPAGLSQTLINSRRSTAHQTTFQWDAGKRKADTL
jgi:hypothetical protein